MSSTEGLASVTDAGTEAVGPASAERAGETDFDTQVHRVQFTEATNDVPGIPASPPPASVGGASSPDAQSASEIRNITIRATDPSISERVGGRIETLNDAKMLAQGDRNVTAPPSAYGLGADAKAEGPVAVLGTSTSQADPFEAAMSNLRSAFHHGIEVELIAKTGTSLNSSMNKLMSGN